MSLYAELIDPDLPGYVEAQAPGGTLPGVLLNVWQEAADQAGTLPILVVDMALAKSVGVEYGAAITVGTDEYIVREIQPKNGGGADLALEQI
ncbi:hypothetical protein [Microbulbifer thermotolerans]|uniref:Uncharacterized protein n=1 Tax=Microbulbifer thermotolerans TaxID=252514 RepID=A0AB35HZC9_MICTH|nr:hypothetical protein [Microbulbifer thermotolerans]MCX2780422.1 hypothetical protein [Microbulbifer thermotolerans]MCX2802256.1 hypothetical protein [Microbulbifer thermotolerans]MCX2805906.1 hypothetical protein [Microbulbifer thermotolerans]